MECDGMKWKRRKRVRIRNKELVKEIENQVDSLYDTISNGFKSLEGEASHLDENSG